MQPTSDDKFTTEKRALQLARLQLQVNDLRYGWLKTMATAVVTALVTVVVAVITTGMYQKSLADPEKNSIVGDVDHWARVVMTSSNAIQQIVTRSAAPVIDLKSVMLYDVNLDGAHLEGANLSSIYVMGNGNGVDFDNANLSNADLQNLTLTNSKAERANVYCSYFESLEQHGSTGSVVGSTVDFKGANRWASKEYPSSQPLWLATYYSSPSGAGNKACYSGLPRRVHPL